PRLPAPVRAREDQLGRPPRHAVGRVLEVHDARRVPRVAEGEQIETGVLGRRRAPAHLRPALERGLDLRAALVPGSRELLPQGREAWRADPQRAVDPLGDVLEAREGALRTEGPE